MSERRDIATGEHEWFFYERLRWECCRKCGIIKRKDGENKPCRGPVHIGLRTLSEPADVV